MTYGMAPGLMDSIIEEEGAEASFEIVVRQRGFYNFSPYLYPEKYSKLVAPLRPFRAFGDPQTTVISTVVLGNFGVFGAFRLA